MGMTFPLKKKNIMNYHKAAHHEDIRGGGCFMPHPPYLQGNSFQ